MGKPKFHTLFGGADLSEQLSVAPTLHIVFYLDQELLSLIMVTPFFVPGPKWRRAFSSDQLLNSLSLMNTNQASGQPLWAFLSLKKGGVEREGQASGIIKHKVVVVVMELTFI